MVVETKERNGDTRYRLSHEITELMHEHFGINIIIDLVRRPLCARKLRSPASFPFPSRETIPGAATNTGASPACQLLIKRKTA